MKLLGLVLSKRKKIAGLVLIAYVVFVLWKTLLCREPGPEYQLKLEPFWSWRKLFDENSPQLMQVLLNIVLFFPFGGLLFVILNEERKKRLLITIVCGVLLSSFIELSQLIFKLGLCELDDVLDNTIGTAVGAVLVYYFLRIMRSIRHVERT